MKRWTFNVAAGVSVVVFVATAVLWARSYRRSDFVQIQWNATPIPITSAEQAAALERLRAELGWESLYVVRFVAMAFHEGRWLSFFGMDGEAVREPGATPRRVKYGTDGVDSLLIKDESLQSLGSLPGGANIGYAWAGFSYRHLKMGEHPDIRRIGIPLWLPVLASSVLPMWWLRQRVVQHARRKEEIDQAGPS